MSKYCVVCGAELSDETVYCNECGAKAAGNDETTGSVQNRTTAPYNNGTSMTQMYPAVPTIAFWGMILLFSIPVIGFIASIVLSFVPQNRNLKNFSRAALIWIVISAVVSGLLFWGLFIFATEHVENWVDENPIFSDPDFWEIVEDYVDGSIEIPSDNEELFDFIETLPDEYKDSIPSDFFADSGMIPVE